METKFEEMVASKWRWVGERLDEFTRDAAGLPAADLVDAETQRELVAGHGRVRMLELRFGRNLIGRPAGPESPEVVLP